MTHLKLTTEAREDHQMQVVAEFEASSLEKYKRQAARKIAGKAKIPGFRPGKAPYDVISRLYGEPAIEEEAIELMVEDIYPQMLTEANINPAAPGSLQDIDKGDPLKFTFLVPLEPTVDLGSYREVRKEYAPKPVSDKQVDEFISRLQRTYATAEPVDRPAEQSDLVYIKIDATVVKPKDEEKPEILKDSPLQLVIGENDPEENDFPYRGFGDNLVGLKANEEKTFKFVYPKDSKYEKLQGKTVEFHVLLQTVKHLILPELNDEFAQQFGEFENFDKLKEGVKAQLETRQTVEYDQGYYEELLNDITAGATIKYPPQMLEHETEHVVEDVTHDLSHQHMELDAYLKTLNKEKEAWLEEDVKPAARKRLERSLVMEELSRAEKVQISKEDVQAEVGGMVQEMQTTGDVKNLEKQLKSERVINALTMQAASRVLNRNVFLRLKDIATGVADEVKTEVEKVEKPKTARKTTKKAAAEGKEPEVKTPAKPKAAKKVSDKAE